MSLVALTFAVWRTVSQVKQQAEIFEAEECPKNSIFPVLISRPGAIFQ
jgi:hypothetical protein